MRKSVVAYIIGLLLIVLAVALVVPTAVAHSYDSDFEIPGFLVAAGASLAAGLALFILFRRPATAQTLRPREGFAVVAFGWILISAFGALPFVLVPDDLTAPAVGNVPGQDGISVIDAFFETISGFTTTGASCLPSPESLPRGLLFWRSFTQWFGGMGIVVLAVAILPFLGAGGAKLVSAEVPGPTSDRLAPRITETAKVLWVVYVGLTVAQTLLLWAHPEIDLFDATCHAFTTVATAGFSTKNASLAAFSSVYVDVVVIVFMLLAGINFALHISVLRGKGLQYLKDSEFRFFLLIAALSVTAVSTLLYFGHYPDQSIHPDKYDSVGDCIRYAAFQVTSLLTTTGFGTADYDAWPNACRFILMLLMFIGGCGGSTVGGVKCVRMLLLMKCGLREILQSIHPRAVLQVRMSGHYVEKEVVARVMGFFALWLVLFGVATLAMMLVLPDEAVPETVIGETLGVDERLEIEKTRRLHDRERAFGTAFGSVLATINNIGPGIGSVGPAESYGFVPTAGKIILIFCMLLGRLDIYCVMALLVPATWR